MWQQMATSESLRLPVLTAQMMIREDEALSKTPISGCAPDQGAWDSRLSYLAPKGITEEHLAHWVWILSAPTGDSMAWRFLSTNTHKPIFLLSIMLDSKNRFRIRDRANLAALLEYISNEYISPRRQRSAVQSLRPRNRTFDSSLNMTPGHFAQLLSKIVGQALELWPAALVTVAHLAASYIESIPASFVTQSGYLKKGQAARCLVLNRALQLFERPPRHHPIQQAKYNWEAQRVLLALANKLQPRLVLNRSSYRSIRRVLLRLSKSPSERTVAERYARTWPPYRQNWYGVDELRAPEDDLSRSAKAGILMLEAGYGEEDHDRALSVLGGGRTDGSPSVQTRSLSPVLWTRSLASLNIYSAWASEVRATRNAQEAWRIFNSPPSSGLTPNVQVFAAMFEKLFAKDVSGSSPVLPGETTRETFPFYDVNLSAFEKARLQPPRAHDLYDRMIHSGVRPVGPCLVQLILNAESVEMGMKFLQDSPFGKDSRALMDDSPSEASLARLRGVPLSVFNAWISLLCRLQEPDSENRRSTHRSGAKLKSYMAQACTLCKLALRERAYAPPWHSLVGALAGPKFGSSRPVGRVHTFLRILDWAKARIGADPVLLEKFALFLQKSLQSMASTPVQIDTRTRREVTALFTARETLISMFNDIANPVAPLNAVGTGLSLPRLYHPISPVHLYRYMRALAAFGDAEEMVRLMRWILRAWDLDSVLEDAKTPEHPHYRSMSILFSYFNSAGEQLVSPEEMQAVRDEAQQLVEEKGCTWVWLNPDHADNDERPMELLAAKRWSVLIEALGPTGHETADRAWQLGTLESASM